MHSKLEFHQKNKRDIKMNTGCSSYHLFSEFLCDELWLFVWTQKKMILTTGSWNIYQRCAAVCWEHHNN